MRRPFRRALAPDTYKLPAVDSARAKANAAQFLAGARTLDGVDGSILARRYQLKPITAQQMLEAELERRSRLL